MNLRDVALVLCAPPAMPPRSAPTSSWRPSDDAAQWFVNETRHQVKRVFKAST